RVPKPRRNGVSVCAQGERGRGNAVKTLAQSRAAASHCLDKALRYVVGVDVMHGFQPEVGQSQFCTASQCRKNLRIEISRWIQWNPSGADDVSRMDNGRWEAVPPALIQQ